MSENRQQVSNHILAITVGLVYLWFGVLKFFQSASPAEDLAKSTMELLTFGLIPSNVSIILLATWETLVGFLLMINVFRRPVIAVAMVHTAFTFSPLFLFPELSFSNPPFSFTFLGQYVFKNIIMMGALVVLYNQSRQYQTKQLHNR